MYRTLFFALALLSTGLAAPSLAADPAVSATDLGDLTGTVVKVGSDSITVKVPTTVQTGVTRRRVGKRTVTVPKYATKQVEETFPLAADVAVKTAAGKAAALADVRAGQTVRLHGYRVTERTPGQSPDGRVEVRRIDIPNPAAKK